MNIVRFRLLLITALILLPLVSVTSVFAAQPEVDTIHQVGSFVAADCGDFLALQDFEVDIRITTFLDQAGNPARVHVHENWEGTLTNSVTGLTVRDPGHFTIRIDLQEGTETHVGLVYGITIPGEGIAVLDAGKVVIDEEGNVVFEGGPHQFLHEGEAVICAALD